MRPEDAMLHGAAKAYAEVLRRQRPDLAFEVTIAKRLNRISRARERIESRSDQPNPVNDITPALPDEHGRERAA